MRGKEEGMETTFLKRKFIRGFGGNEENRYATPDLNKAMINVTNEPNDTHKKKIPQTATHGRNH
jgi:hypothetical protein